MRMDVAKRGSADKAPGCNSFTHIQTATELLTQGAQAMTDDKIAEF